MTSREKGWVAALSVLAVLALIELFYIPGHNPWLEALNNAGHLPVFGLLAIAILHLVKLARPSLRARPALAYGIALALSAALGALSEGVQHFTPRDADITDLLRDVVGAASFLALYAAIRDRDLREARAQRPRLKPALLAVTGLLWLAGGWPLLVWTAAYVQRQLQLPVLCDFDSRLSTRFLEANGTQLEFGATSDITGVEARGTRMVFEASEWPVVEIIDVYPDWTEHDSLVLDLTVESDQPLVVALSAFDRDHNQTMEDRFTRGFTLDPGRQRLAVSLGHVIVGPRSRTMDVEHMEVVRIFSDSSAKGRSVLLERLYLK